MTTPETITYGIPVQEITAQREPDADPAVYFRTLEALRTNARLQEPSTTLHEMSDEDIATLVLSQAFGVPFCSREKGEAFAARVGVLAAKYLRTLTRDLPFKIMPNPFDLVHKFTTACTLEAARRSLERFDVTVINLEFTAVGMQLTSVFTLNGGRVTEREMGAINDARIAWCCRHAKVCGSVQAEVLRKMRDGLS